MPCTFFVQGIFYGNGKLYELTFVRAKLEEYPLIMGF